MSQLLLDLITELGRGSLKVIDLTQPLGPETPVIGLPPIFAASPGASIETISCYDERGPGWYWNTLRFGEHTGTHFDAPIHWVTGKGLPANACDTIPVRRFIGPACVIDVTADVDENPDFLLTPERIVEWERDNGRIPAGSWVLLRTGWSRRRSATEFLNVAGDGPHSPGFDARASTLLAHERDILGVGVETIGTDAGQAGGFDPPFPNHTIMHGAGKFGLASLCNLEQLPATGAIVIAAPLKIVKGSGSPLRAIAIAPDQSIVPPRAGAMKHILIVDDDARLLASMSRALVGYRLTIARDGAEALALAQNGRVDLLITDYMMPSMAGDELLGRLREQQPGVKALVVSGHGSVLAREVPEWWEAEAHLDKPFEVDALREAVIALIGPPD